jgi:endonuclease/exonuclease/phosphatase family metal-dependent hydrolase
VCKNLGLDFGCAATQSDAMNLLSYNIQYGFGADGVYDLTRAARVMQGADIIALQEVERHWSRSNFDDQPARLEALLPEYYTAYGPAFDMDASTLEGDRVINRRRQFGTMILSRWPIRWSRLHLLPMRRMLTPLNTQNPALEAMIDTPLGPLRVLSIHLAHVGVEERLTQIDHLLALHRSTAATGGPWSGRDDEPSRNWTEGEAEPLAPGTAIWLGDFNSEPGSAEYARITGSTPYHPGARYAGGLVDAVAQAGVQLHTHRKVIAGAERLRQLDHGFVTADLAPRLQRVWTDNAEMASDHSPLWIELS